MPLVKTAQIDEAFVGLNSNESIVDPTTLFAAPIKPVIDVMESIVSVSWDDDLANIPVSVYKYDRVQHHPGVPVGQVTIITRPSTTTGLSESSLERLLSNRAAQNTNVIFQMKYGAAGAQLEMAFIGLLGRRSSAEDQRRDRNRTWVFNLTKEGLAEQ